MEPLFHGTAADFSAPTVSSYDQVWWTAPDSAIAQTYIPVARGTVVLNVFTHDMKARVIPCRPGINPLWDIATMIQSELLNSVNADYDAQGHATSYTIGDAHPRVGDICGAIENIFGYLPEDSVNSMVRKYRLHIERTDDLGRQLYAAAAWRLPGFLWIVNQPIGLKLFDMTGSSSGDLADLQYHKIGRFKTLCESGYDGIIVNDFTLSPTWGNVGHTSYGFFAHAIPKLRLSRVPARNLDWGPEPSQFIGVMQSPEYKAWLSDQRRAA
jgi:hypothetical protein